MALVLVPLFFSSCGILATPNPVPSPAAATKMPIKRSSTPSSVTANVSPSPILKHTLTIQPTPTANPPYPQLKIPNELPTLDLSGAGELHDLIVFRSTVDMPFLLPSEESNRLSRHGNLGLGYLWAVSPDGQRAGRVSPDGFGFDLYQASGGKLQFIEYGFTLNQSSIQPVTLPDICTHAPAGEDLINCDQVRFSPDGRYLGFRYGPDTCGRALRLIDLRSGDTLLDLHVQVQGYTFLSNAKVGIYTGTCDENHMIFFDPLTRQTIEGGLTGLAIWNPDASIFVDTSSIEFYGDNSSLWGYRLKTSNVFHPEPATQGRKPIDEHVIWQALYLPAPELSIRFQEREGVFRCPHADRALRSL
jgi:hypothetical protein